MTNPLNDVVHTVDSAIYSNQGSYTKAIQVRYLQEHTSGKKAAQKMNTH